ncbi:hypothetical protein BD414DRAFT_499252 [Trametes punicea]|nr:hypothetical protein BD414DRAFT_499252 [Trametes punicea]
MSPSTRTVSDPAYYSSAMSYHEWKREPTLSSVLFGLHMPYRKPQSPIAQFFWRRRVWIEVTFALSMLEPWEKLVVVFVIYAALLLLAVGCVLYLPQHLSFLHARAAYYFFGSADPSAAASDSLDRLKHAASWGLNASLANVSSLRSSLVGLGTSWGAASSSEL